MLDGEPIEDRGAASLSQGSTAIRVAQQDAQNIRELFLVTGSNQISTHTGLDNFTNSLPLTSDHRLATRHCLKINAPQAFVATRQGENGAFSHRCGNRGARLTSVESYSLRDLQPGGQLLQGATLRAVANDPQLQRR